MQAIHGSAWSLAGYGVTQLLRLVTQLVLARMLLDPTAFGLVALVNVFLSGLEMLSDLGIGMDVIQHARGDDPRLINTAFLIQAGRGTILFALSAALAYPFAHFYKQPAVSSLAIVAALSIGIRGFASGSIWTMTRHLQLRKLTLLTLSSEVFGVIASLCWVYFSPSAWALVVGRVAASFAYMVGSHLVSNQRVSLDWDSSAARDIFLFGAGIFVSTATYFLGGEAERLVIGKFITVAELGCFSLALTISSAPSRAIQQVVGQVFFPMISSTIRTDTDSAVKHYRSARWVFLMLGIVLGMGFIAYSHRLVVILLPPKYAMTAWMLQLLGFRAALEVFSAATVSVILACGDSRYAAISNTIRLGLMASGIWIAFNRYGTRQAIEVLAFVPALTYLVLVVGVGHHLRRALWPELVGFLLFLAAMLVAFVIPWPWA